MQTAVFAYGSLVSPASFAATLGRDPGQLVPARLAGWRRRWSLVRDNLASEKTFTRAEGEMPPWVVGLNLEPDEPDVELAPNGALIEIDEAELRRLDLRELRYHRIDVSDALAADDGFDRVLAYTAKHENLSPEPPAGAVAIAPYLRAVEKAFRELGEGEWELFLRTTGRPPVELIEPVLIRDEIPPGNPRGW